MRIASNMRALPFQNQGWRSPVVFIVWAGCGEVVMSKRGASMKIERLKQRGVEAALRGDYAYALN
jgi:hypothetical protein